MRPGETISDPQSEPDTKAAPEDATPQEERPLRAEAKEEPVAQWSYQQGSPSDSLPEPSAHVATVSWTASEFVAHDKSPFWYVVLGGVAAIVAAGFYLLTKDMITLLVIIVVAILLGISAARRPRVLDYQISNTGITIGPKKYPYGMFKSFAVIEEDAINSITLLPVKRFMPPISMYYPPEQEVEIVETLGDYLPFEHRERDMVDRLVHRLRF